MIGALLDDRQDLHILLTTGTVTSAKLMATRLPDRAMHQYAPLDRAGAWRRFFNHWRPEAGCLVESEIWPNLILEAKRSNLPLTLVNGRMSSRSARRWGMARVSARRLLGSFALCLVRSQVDADRFSALGAVDVRMLGDLKNATPPLPATPAALAELRAMIGKRPVWLAASTHPGEERGVVAAHRQIRRRHPDLLTVIAPRHPERGEELARELRASGEALARRSLSEQPDAATGIYLADTLGELGLFYRVASLAFIGGSLVPHGGQNPLEAARLGCPTLFGPHTGNFEEMTAHLLDVAAARRVGDADELARAVDALLADSAAREQMANQGREAGAAEEGVLIRVQQALMPLLEREIRASAAEASRHACA